MICLAHFKPLIMNIMSIQEKISDAISCHKKDGNFSVIESLYKNQTLYHLQYFWDSQELDDSYLKQLLNYRKGALFLNIFSLKYYSFPERKFKNCVLSKVKQLPKIIQFLVDKSPSILLTAIQRSQVFLKEDFESFLPFLENSENQKLIKFTELTTLLRKQYLTYKSDLTALLKKCNNYSSIAILYHLNLHLSNHSIEGQELNYVLDLINELTPRNSLQVQSTSF